MKVIVHPGLGLEPKSVAHPWRRVELGRTAVGWLRGIAALLSMLTLQGLTPRAGLVLEEGAAVFRGSAGLVVPWLRGRPADRLRALSRGIFRGPLSRVDVLGGDACATEKDFMWMPNRESRLRDAPELLIAWADVTVADLTRLGRRRAGLGLLMNDGSEIWLVIRLEWQGAVSVLEQIARAGVVDVAADV